jgi:SAM-dependent methyltransferase
MKFNAQLPVEQLIPPLCEWFDSPLGQEVVQAEQTLAETVLPTLFGYHLLQVGLDHRQVMFQASPVSRKVMLMPQMQLGATPMTIIADHDELPVCSNELDVVVLHHALDYAANPHQVLREAARVLRPGGFMLSFSFNPTSYWGLWSRLTRRHQPPWGGHQISHGRLHDWLSLLQMTEVKVQTACHHLPLESPVWRRRLGMFERLSRRIPGCSGAVLMVLARKDVAGMTPIRPGWKRQRLLSLPVAEPKPTARGKSI